ncbi:hypothetical protein KKG83_05415 [Candidatus Micrarchaeota archaeon]|nr:hypothetical protein [Candidatus Micrarchaeota archaeon]MBU2476882.1 hypothetical protein [Candidatus Micrarchaeota archaeon]
MKLNQKGQEFEVFNVLIGAVLALAILVIIISLINYLEDLKVTSSRQVIEQKLKSAAQSPDGSIFVAKGVILPQDSSFNSQQFGFILNIEPECIEFDFPQEINSMYYPNSSKNTIGFSKRVQTEFYVLCQKEDIDFSGYNGTLECNSENCEFCCLASFGVNPAMANN